MSSTSGSVFYVDTSNNVNPKLQGNYVSFNVTNDTGSAIADAWVTIGSFTGGFVSLAPNENGIAHLGAMSTGATKPVFFYLQVDCSTFSAGQCNIAAAQGFTVKLYSGPPTTNLLQSQAFSTTVSETISSSNNSVTTVTVSTSSPTLGSTVNVTVTGVTGTIGAAKIFYASPQTNVTFPATSFRLVSTSVTFSGANTGTVTNQLLVPSSTFTSTASTSYSFVSTYLVVGTTSTSTAVAPVAFISSGAQVKHTDTSSFAQLSPIGAATNSLTLSKLVNTAVWPTGGTPTFTLRVTNSSSTSATLDDFVDTLPSSPASVTYASGTSTFGGSAISNPTISGSTLTWTSTFAIPANGTVDLTFQATVPNVAGSYTNSAVAHLNGNQIDTTTSTSDNSPATVSLSVGSPDLTISKSHTGNFTQGQTGATYSITVSNAGSGPSAGTVSVVDTLPTGLTASALSGTGWSCTLGTLTCTRSDVLNSSASYPVITLTANVASNAVSSVTNTATVSGGGETNTTNDSASDVTTVTQLPDLTISKSHTGNFTQGQTGATYSITATNSGSAATSGTVTVVDTLPTGLTATAITGTGWSCTLGTLTCTRSDALSASGSYPTITLTVNVANNAAASVTNTATVGGGGETNTTNDAASDVTTVTQLPDLTISKSHTGNFAQGQTGASYSITVTNSGSAATSGIVTVVDTLPTGLTATALSGTGWSCTLGTLTCTRSDALSASSSYPAITLTVNVANNAAASVTNAATVSGGGETNTANDSASDVTTVTQLPDLTISKSHSGNFTQGQTGATYSITATNSGSAATSGTVTVVDTLPTGLTATALSGTGWSCTLGTLTCTRSDALSASGSYPAITLTVNVANNAAGSITNTATVSGGGETNTANDSASDLTTVTQLPDLTISKTHSGNFTQAQTGATYSITATNSGSAATSGTVTVVDTLPAGLTATAISGTGWSCTLGTLTCTRTDALSSSSSYPAITLTVNVANNAAGSVTNTATVSGGGESNTANDSASDATTVTQLPDLTISKSHSGNFTQGQTGATYSITVTNSGSAATSGTVTVVDTLPAGLTATAMSGTGWSCALGTLTCTRSDVLSTSSSYPAITLTVNVANNAAGSVTNTATVSGGGEANTANDSASDVTTVTQLPDLTITKSHTGNFAQGQTGATYSIAVTNSGSAASSGTVTVVDTLPTGLTATALSGTGWSCTLGTLTCTRSDALNASSSYPAIALTVNVANNAAGSVTNTATVSGGGETNTANDSSSDVTTITQLPDLTISKTHSGNFTQGQTGATYSITVSNLGSAATSGTVTVVDTLPTGLTATAMSGIGWSCTLGTLTCTRSDALNASNSYPAITLTVNVASNTAASVTNTATVSGGGESNTANDSSSDVTTIVQLPDLTVSKSHTGDFTQGETGAIYSIVVHNVGTGPTASTVTVVDTLPAGLSATAISGTGWTCTLATLTCTRSDTLAASSSYPAITLTVNVAGNAATSVTNNVAVSGGGESNTANDTASDVTTVTASSAAATSTSLSVSPALSVNAGTQITLTATVTASSVAVFPGVVDFCNTTATQCAGLALLGTAQLKSDGTAVLKLTPGEGTYSLVASFRATTTDQASSSTPQVLTVTGIGNYVTATTLSFSGTSASYSLTGTVAAFGKPVPTGTISFVDTSNGNNVLGSPSLDPATLGFESTLLPGSSNITGTPTGAATTDLNNDGILDVVIATGSTTKASVFIGNGDGSFLPEATVDSDPAGPAIAVAVGDFNGDGKLDLAILNSPSSGPGSVSILLGNGDGTFQSQVAYAAGSQPSGIVVADFNGDGNADIAVTNRGDNSVSVLFGNGDGTFQVPVTLAVDTAPFGLVTADLKNDGITDIITANNGDNTISVLIGNGDGTFATQVPYAVGNSPVAIVAEDFNGDGNVDVAVANQSDGTVGTLLGNGDGTFQNQTTFAASVSPSLIAIGDFDGDGNADLAVSDSAVATINIFLGKGDGTFKTAVTASPTGIPNLMVSGDANGDGLTDIFTANNSASAVLSALLSQHTESATITGVSFAGTGTHLVEADYSGDSAYAASQSTPVTLSGVGATPTTTSLTAAPNPTTSGQGVLLTATVSPAPSGSPFGTVSFFDGATLLATVNVNSSGVATTTISSLSVGSHSITAVYSGNNGFATSTSNAVTEVISTPTPTATSTVLVASPNPAIAGQSILFTATVTPTPTGAPLGTVSFFDGATLLGSGNVNASGVATFSDSSLTVGSHSITASYSGNAGFASSTSSPVTEVISSAPPTPTTTALVANPNPVTAGQPLTLTATVSPVPSGSPLGTVSFFDGATLLGTVSVNSSGVATLNTSSLTVGSHSITAVYSGNSGFAGSTSNAVTEVVSPASPTTTSTALTANPNSATVGQTILFTAIVTPTPTGAPLGTVSFFDGATLLGSGNVNSSGVATFSESALVLGSHTITATYSGNSGFASSTSTPVTEVISSAPPATTTTTLLANPNPVTVGQPLTLTATVSPIPSGSPLGSVSFFDGATLLGTVNVNASGVATFNTSGLTVGSHSITAVYSGNSGFAGSTSNAVTEIVSVANPTATTTVLGAVPNPASFGASVQLTATVSPVPSGSPLGTVSFFDGSTLLGTANLNSSGVATLPANTLSAGSHSLTAVYSGNAGFATSTSSPVTQVISAVSTGTSLTANPNPAVAGQSVLLTGTVSPAPTGSPLGTISFFDGSTLLGTANVNASGVASLTTNTLVVGSHTLTAVYSGNANFATSTSSPVTQVISAPAPTATSTSLAVSPNPATPAQSVTLTASVTPIPTGSPLGTVSFFDGSTLLGTVNVNASGVAVLSITTLSAGTHSLTAVYSGNAGFATSTSSAVPLTVNNAPPVYTVSAPPTPFSVAPGAAVTILVNVAPTGNPFTNVVTMSATGLPPGATASFAPPTVIPGSAGTTTNMTIQTARQAALLVPGNPRLLYGSLVLIAICFVPFWRTASRPWALTRVTVLLFLVVVLGTVGCNGGFAGKPAPQQTFVITVTGTSGSLHPSTTVTLIVE